MKGPGVPENRRLLGLLEAALVREARLWKAPVFKGGFIQGGDISLSQHQDMIVWLGDMNRRFHFCPETFALGACVLNRMLSTVKAQPKYFKCIAFTSLVLAAKINEEDEFHALLVYGHPHLIPSTGHQKRPPGFQVALWTRQVQHCMACHQLWQFKGSTLALAIITLELEALTPDWFSVFTDLLKDAQVDSVEFIHCKEMVDEHLRSLEFALPDNAVYIFDSAHIHEGEADKVRPPSRRLRRRSKKGPSADRFRDSDEYYDGLKRLYSEETCSKVEGGSVGGSPFDSSQESASPCPPLHPPN
ncbi:cyclin-I isoform X2 [Syngnathus typhle]|uniref:cyclin-I isoform X2 n=1 Tax=Syngnathus typhle TaxID=161592 RepID=UPI002A699AAC|nr:cyclin-I isoform X2 [Syngnathus typhle]